ARVTAPPPSLPAAASDASDAAGAANSPRRPGPGSPPPRAAPDDDGLGVSLGSLALSASAVSSSLASLSRLRLDPDGGLAVAPPAEAAPRELRPPPPAGRVHAVEGRPLGIVPPCGDDLPPAVRLFGSAGRRHRSPAASGHEAASAEAAGRLAAPRAPEGWPPPPAQPLEQPASRPPR
ncbi:unnamed protein product, partial [Prorocentrum cordatum]